MAFPQLPYARAACRAKGPRQFDARPAIVGRVESWFTCWRFAADSISPMPYRRTDNVSRRLAARREAIIAAARTAAGEGGLAAVQIIPVAAKAGIAAGTVYRYFPGKTDLVAALLGEISEREIGELRRSADVAPGLLSALSAAVMTFATRALRHRRLAYAAIAEPVEAELDVARLGFRKALAAEFGSLIAAAVGHLPEQGAGPT